MTFMMGVYPEYQGRKIGYHLVEANNQLGRMKGFHACDCRGDQVRYRSESLLTNTTITLLMPSSTKTFGFKGNVVLRESRTCDSCQLVYKDLYSGIEKGWEHT